ncbi:MAG TPA: carboxylesterase family protein, partial [Thermoanaerobaculia bacterium]|nr:carboxylesterase family protein [Thermoanaerobaculia bacterium]
ADLMASYWVSFAESGDPNGAGLPEWPVYTAENDIAMAFGVEAAPRSAIRKRELDLFDRLAVAAMRE